MLHQQKIWVLCSVSFICIANLLFTTYHSQSHCELVSKNGLDYLGGCPQNILDFCQGAYSASVPRDISEESPEFNYLCPWGSFTTMLSLLGLFLTLIYLMISIWAQKRRRVINNNLPPWIWCIILTLILGMILMIKDILIGYQTKQDLYKQSDFSNSHMWNLSLHFSFIVFLSILSCDLHRRPAQPYDILPSRNTPQA